LRIFIAVQYRYVGTFSILYSRKTFIHLVCLRVQGVAFQSEFSEAAGLFKEQDVSCITSSNY